MVLTDERKIRYQDKLTQLDKNLIIAKSGLEKSASEILNLYGTLRSIQLLIQVIIDISAMFVKDHGKIPSNNYSNLNVIQTVGLINDQITQGLYSLIGLRNRIAHVYNGLDEELALKSFKENTLNVEKFVQGIKSWLKLN